MKRTLVFFLIFLSIIYAFSCKSIKQPQNVPQTLDYTDKDVVENEISNIRALQETESTKALFRAYLLGDSEIIDECKTLVSSQAQKALEENDYSLAMRLYKSLAAVEMQAAGEIQLDGEIQSAGEIQSSLANATSSFYNDVPGLSVDSQKLPATTTDCINATVTVWVDQGYRVENGAGYADIVIGSGFFIDRRGYIITNHHVIQEVVNPKRKTTCKLYIKLPSDMEKKIPAKVVGYDPIIDLALLKVEFEPQFVFELGSSSDLSVGDHISVIGTPIGLEGTYTTGTVSSTSRQLITMGKTFQIDAAVNSGNSGGPLIDKNNKVQAIVFAGIFQYQGLNFAIPVEYLKQELPLLYKGDEIKHCWLGAYGHTLRIQNEEKGLEIQYVMPGGSASFSGLKIDDVITKVDGVEITSLETLQTLFMKYEPGTILNCTYTRDGQENNCIIYLEKRPDAPVKQVFESDFVDESFIPIFGMKLTRSSTTNKKSYRIEYVIEGSAADQNGFSENDSLELRGIDFDDRNEIFSALIVIQRKKHGLLDIQMVLASSYDNPNYF